MTCVAGWTPIRPGPGRHRSRYRERARMTGRGVNPARAAGGSGGNAGLAGPRDMAGRVVSRPHIRVREMASTPRGAARLVLFRRQPPKWRVRHPPGSPPDAQTPSSASQDRHRAGPARGALQHAARRRATRPPGRAGRGEQAGGCADAVSDHASGRSLLGAGHRRHRRPARLLLARPVRADRRHQQSVPARRPAAGVGIVRRRRADQAAGVAGQAGRHARTTSTACPASSGRRRTCSART